VHPNFGIENKLIGAFVYLILIWIKDISNGSITKDIVKVHTILCNVTYTLCIFNVYTLYGLTLTFFISLMLVKETGRRF